jgi:hypothetical protein
MPMLDLHQIGNGIWRLACQTWFGSDCLSSFIMVITPIAGPAAGASGMMPPDFPEAEEQGNAIAGIVIT